MSQERKKILKNIVATSCYSIFISTMLCIQTAHADWFQVQDVRANLITPIYNVVNENLGVLAFAVGGIATIFARGQDLWQKATAFAAGSVGFAGAVKVSQLFLDLG